MIQYQIAAELLKNMTMKVPAIRIFRKRLHSVQNDPASEIQRQMKLHWPIYTSALASAGLREQLSGAHVLEIGPGPILANGVLFIAAGAACYTAIDRYDLYRTDHQVRLSYEELIATLTPGERSHCVGLFQPGENGTIFDDRIRTMTLTIEQAVRQLPPEGFDLIFSFNVLEHLDDIGTALDNTGTLLRRGGAMVHRVDVSTHSNGESMHPLWQLTIPEWLWSMMYSGRAYPNRARPSEYLRHAEQVGLKTLVYQVTSRLSDIEVERIRPRLQPEFRDCLLDDLTTLDFIWVMQKP